MAQKIIHLYNSPTYGICATHCAMDQVTRDRKKVTCKKCKEIIRKVLTK